MAEPGSRFHVAISHPGAPPFVFPLAAAVQDRGHDLAFLTSFFVGSGLLDASARLPSWLRRRLERQLRRRHHPGIDPAAVHLWPYCEILRVLVGRLPFTRDRRAAVLDWRNLAFDRHVATRLSRLCPDVFIGHDTSCLRSLKAMKQAGGVAAMSQVIGHVAVGRKILAEEAELHPDFADSLPPPPTESQVEHCLEEARTADFILAPSAYVRDTMIEIGIARERICLLPFGVEVERFRPPDHRTRRPFRLLYVGQISQRKGIKYMLEAVRRLNLPDVEVVLVGGVVGSGEGLAPYRDLIRHHPNLPHHEVHRLFRDANLFVYPSLHEGSALAIYEALASGLPVITTANAGSVVRDGEEGIIVPTRDLEALMGAIERCYRDAALCEEMAEKARRRALQFSWDNYADRLDAILRRMVSDDRQGVEVMDL